MLPRVGTAFAGQIAVDTLNQRNAAASRLQEQIATGSRISTASDAPVDAAEAERLRSSNSRSAVARRMMDFAKNTLGQASGALDTGANLLQSVRENLIAAGNGAYSPGDRALLAKQLEGMRGELLSLANQGDGSGGYIFGGQGATSAPFAPPGNPVYTARNGTQQTGLDMAFDMTVDGSRVFLGDGSASPTGSIFASLDTVIAQLKDPATPDIAGALTTAMKGVDNTFDRLNTARTEAGEQLRAIDSRQRLLESGELQNTTRRSALMDTDYAKALSEVAQHEVATQAAMRTYAQISKLSLFDYL